MPNSYGAHLVTPSTTNTKQYFSPTKYLRKASANLLFIATAIQISGCELIPPKIPLPKIPDSAYISEPSNVAVLPSTIPPTFKFEGYKREGAKYVASECYRSIGGNPLAVLLSPIICALWSPIGSSIGSANSPSDKEIESIKNHYLSTGNQQNIHVTLRDIVVNAARVDNLQLPTIPISSSPAKLLKQGYPDYRAYADSGFSSVLEISLTKLGLERNPKENMYFPYMLARARLIRTKDNAEVFSEQFAHIGIKAELQKWQNERDLFPSEVIIGLNHLGTEIYERIFLLYPFPDRTADRDIYGDSFGLAAIEPRIKRGKYIRHSDSSLNVFARSESLQPTMQWESFPRKADREINPAEMSRVTNVRYDLQFFQLTSDNTLANAIPILQYVSLPSNSYTVETPLEPKTRYLWKVRARFEIDGHKKVTEWSTWIHHLFVTP